MNCLQNFVTEADIPEEPEDKESPLTDDEIDTINTVLDYKRHINDWRKENLGVIRGRCEEILAELENSYHL